MAVEKSKLSIGCKVTYTDNQGYFRKGVVKDISSQGINTCHVVYNCNDDWLHFKNYTGELTSTENLELGWPDEGNYENYFTHTDLYLFEEIKGGKSVMYFFVPHEELNSMELKFLSKVLSETFPFDPCDLDTSNLEEVFTKGKRERGFSCLTIFRSDVDEWGYTWVKNVTEKEIKESIEESGFPKDLSNNYTFVDLNKIYNRKVGMAPAISNNQIIEFLQKYGS